MSKPSSTMRCRGRILVRTYEGEATVLAIGIIERGGVSAALSGLFQEHADPDQGINCLRMTQQLRFLALYDWVDYFDFAKRSDVLVQLTADADVEPRKIGVLVAGEKKPRRRTVRDVGQLEATIARFQKYDWITLDDPVAGDLTDVRSFLFCQLDPPRYLVAKGLSGFSISDALRHLTLLCTYITPRYGFVHSAFGLAATAFPAGVATTSSDKLSNRRAHDLGRSLHRDKRHLAGWIHDVYQLNVLSPPHLERIIDGKPLREWIREGGRGELMEITSHVFAWTVPDSVRIRVRAKMMADGLLIASI